jgi:protocatechuate 3,4-dioxygenase, beta subunit
MTTSSFPLALALSLCTFVACHGQPPAKDGSATTGVVGGPFENGEFLYIGMPKQISSVDTSEGWNQKGQKLLITGTIYQLDGKTPAPNVILYYYHTDINGVYANRPGLDSRVVRHGYIRGWVKSDARGKYAIYTVKPAPYPNRNMEAHIHPAIKEPDIDKEYYIDEFVFDDDKLLTREKRKRLEQRGGSGILRVQQQGELQIAQHDIILGLNIPNYPVSLRSQIKE